MLIVTHDLALAEQADRTISIRDGRVSTETISDKHPQGHIVSRESVVIDRVGRLQLPHKAMERYAFRGRADIHFEDDHIEIWPLSARSVLGKSNEGEKDR